MRAVVIVWKVNAIKPKNEDTKLPMRVHRARRPMKSESTAKKSPISMKANMKRVIR